ncbi:MAG: hypothetical protein LBT31_08915, partial [Synergistaceae bacterium]|nr:hypothetical protein [Synergistaceae bacterium]
DGIVAISRADHISNAGVESSVIFDTGGVVGRTAVLATTWTGANGDTFDGLAGRLTFTTDGVIDVRGTRFTIGDVTTANVIAAHSNTLTKIGAGPLRFNSGGAVATAPWANAGNTGTLEVASGDVILNQPEVFGANVTPTVSVSVGEGARLVVGNAVRQNVRELTGDGTIQLLEGSLLQSSVSGTFAGYITGAGSIGVLAGAQTISGATNDYTGDTVVDRGATVVINHASNLGGSKLSRVYLGPQVGAIGGPAAGATLRIAEGVSFILPNEIYVGSGLKTGAGVDTFRNAGESTIQVPKDGRLELANNITYNQNALAKIGEGDLVISSLGYDSIGDGTFSLAATNVRTALHILNGRLRIENAKAADRGDIIVDAGGATASRPILSIRNGLSLTNAVRFTDQSSFQTELIDANLDEGTSVKSAVEVGHVSATNTTDIVYNRVAFDQLAGGTVKKGQDFQLLRATSYTRYASPQVEPVNWDGQVKAPFDPYFSNVYLYFKATHNIDAPVIGSASVVEVAPAAAYSIEIPVANTSGLKAGSAAVNTTLPGATVRIAGNSLIVSGTAPALVASEDVYAYRVSVSTAGEVATDTLEFEGYKDFTLTVTETPGSNPGQPTGPLWSWSVPTPSLSALSGSLTLTDDITGTRIGVPNIPVEFVLTRASDNLFIKSSDITPTGSDGSASFAFSGLSLTYDTNYTLAAVVSGGSYATPNAHTVSIPTPGSTLPTGGSGGGGCDAGFGILTLLAAGAFVTLRRKG